MVVGLVHLTFENQDDSHNKDQNCHVPPDQKFKPNVFLTVHKNEWNTVRKNRITVFNVQEIE